MPRADSAAHIPPVPVPIIPAAILRRVLPAEIVPVQTAADEAETAAPHRAHAAGVRRDPQKGGPVTAMLHATAAETPAAEIPAAPGAAEARRRLYTG